MNADVWLAAASLLFAVISGTAGMWAWWEANRSREARKNAETAADQAARAVSAAEASAANLRQLVDRLTPDPLQVTWITHDRFEVHNTTAEPVEIVELLNADEFTRLPFMPPVTIPAMHSVSGQASAKYTAGPFPLQAIVRVAGRPEPLVVRFFGRPAKT